MALNKQTISLNFAQGLDLKTDPNQVSFGHFLGLSNMVFGITGLLEKRNGYGTLPALPIPASTVTTFNDNLIAAGSNISALLQGDQDWVNQGFIQPVALSTLPLVRSSVAQIDVDTSFSYQQFLVATGWSDSMGNSWYQVQDDRTGQIAVGPIQLPSTATKVRMFTLGGYFMVLFLVTVGGSTHLQYVAVPTANPSNPSAATDVATNVTSLAAPYDAVVANNTLFVAWAASTGSLQYRYITAGLMQSAAVTQASTVPALISLCADLTPTTPPTTSPVIWISYYDGTDTWCLMINTTLGTVHGATPVIGVLPTILRLTTAAQDSLCTLFLEVTNDYPWGPPSNYIEINTCTQGGTAGVPSVLLRSVGLGSKAFIVSGKVYVGLAYGSTTSGLLQPTYFFTDVFGDVILKLAYSNGGGYYPNYILPSVSVNGMIASLGYLFKDLISSVNPGNLTPPTTTANIYSQTGINLANIDLAQKPFLVQEIGGSLMLGGGFTWQYDGVKPVEQGFHLFPEDVNAVVTSTTGGFIIAQQYYYVAVYEWIDGAGQISRSSPSIPVGVNTTGTTNTSTITIQVPTARLTYKTVNKIKVTIYRWSQGQQNYFQITSIQTPLLNNTTIDSVSFVDTLADSTIDGNNLLYTTGGVIEDIAAPANNISTLFNARLWIVDAEDMNLLWYSKQVIEGTPVEMSDLLTLYVAPTTGAVGSTGNITALAPMDDKLIIFKANAIYYINGTGPDNTGANNTYSDPIFISAAIGCVNPQSIALIPNGLMFESNQGIWLLGRDLSTTYIGAPVQGFNGNTVTSANFIPGTTQVRFTLNTSTTLLYDFFYNQWSTFSLQEITTSTIYQGLHTFLNAAGQAFQETSGEYLDGSSPVLMSFTTSWLQMAGLQGYQRMYFFFLLGQYLSPHRLQVSLAYDFNPSPSQAVLITPDNQTPNFGGDTLFGGSPGFGGLGNLEQWQVFPELQRCQALQISVTEFSDPNFPNSAGPGFTMNGVDIVYGGKAGRPYLAASRQIG